MRNFTLPLVASFLLSLLALNISAQKTLPPQETPGNNASRARCGTMEALEIWFNQNPSAREQYLRNVEEGKKLAAEALKSGNTGSNEANRLQAIVTIPVVVHLVLPPARQAQVTKADVLWQINKMNEDFAGINADSTNAPNFYGIRGHSQIRFCLAQQDANGNPTDGINRVYSTITNFSSGTVGTIKHANSCGADAWDPNRYFNIWVAQSTSLLGIATFPGTGQANEQGIALAVDGFGNNPVYVNPFFNLGRTAVHEAGHYFGLYHNWGDDGTSCGTDDFRPLTGSTCILPANLLIGDTPNQAGATGGCPTGVRTDLCSPVSPGFNYQNYMDYTDDACYSMFTNKQVERAEWVLQNCRQTLTTSNGCTPVTVYANDAATQLLSPGNSCYPGSASTTFCQNTTFSTTVMLRNIGTSNLTSATINAVVGNGTVLTTNWTGNLAPFASTIVTINGVSAGATGGTLPLRVYTTNPNGAVDQRPSNDTASVNVTITAAGGGVSSITEGFENTTFPPTGWTVINPNSGSLTWTRFGTAGSASTASARMNYYSYPTSPGHLDYLATPIIDVTDADSILVKFDRAYKVYSASLSDTLMIQLATQCGATTFPITAWKKGGSQLATAPGTGGGSWVPLATDWGTETVNVRPFIPAGTTSLVVSFTGRNGYGQNLYLDNINIRTVVLVRRDAQLRAITSPLSKICSGAISPRVEIFNAGKDTLTTVRVNYRILGPSYTLNADTLWTGSLPQGQATFVNLRNITLPTAGNYTIQAWTSNPNNGTDQNTANDTSTVVSFRFVPTVPLPLTESFESAIFPPPNWARVNQDGQGTWFRTTAASRLGAASAVIDNYNYDAKGTIDDLETPLLSYNGIDSAFLTFQVAHATYLYPGSTGLPLDSLQVLVTKDCGQTFTVVYNKWGEDLQTVNDPNRPVTNLFIPNNSGQWRKETVNLSGVFGSSGTLQVIFRSKGNFGNTLLLDDINITTKTLPARLKQQGYMIAPNPFNGSFAIQHYLRPTNLRGIQVTNSAGQLVYYQNFNGNADSYIRISLMGYASGMYAVKLIYDNKVITERVIKRD